MAAQDCDQFYRSYSAWNFFADAVNVVLPFQLIVNDHAKTFLTLLIDSRANFNCRIYIYLILLRLFREPIIIYSVLETLSVNLFATNHW
jgi:hypothetical protein